MRVLHIVYNLMRGGTEGQCARIVMEMARCGGAHRVAVFKREGFFLDKIEAVCGPVFEIEIAHFFSSKTFREVKKLRDILRDESFDLVHAWDADAAIFGGLAAYLAGVPFVTSRRDMGEIYSGYKLWLMRQADLKAVKIVVNAKAIKRGLIRDRIPSEKIHVLNNMLDLGEFDSLAKKPSVVRAALPAGRNIAMVARLDKEKGLDVLIRAFAVVLGSADDVHLLIVGDGGQRHLLEQLATDLGISKAVFFLGEQNDVPAILSECVAGVLVPSSNEGLSNSILEYMAAELPVVVTDCGGNCELVADGVNGYVVPVNNHEAISDALISVLDNKEIAHEMGCQGRLRVEREFGIHTVVLQYEQFYQSIYETSNKGKI